MHTDGPGPDWTQIVALYDQLMRLDGSAIVRLNRAVAVGEHAGLDRGLALVDDLEPELGDYHAFHATRADLLRRLGRSAAAADAYDAAIALAGNAAEVAYLTRQRSGLRSD